MYLVLVFLKVKRIEARKGEERRWKEGVKR